MISSPALEAGVAFPCRLTRETLDWDCIKHGGGHTTGSSVGTFQCQAQHMLGAGPRGGTPDRVLILLLLDIWPTLGGEIFDLCSSRVEVANTTARCKISKLTKNGNTTKDYYDQRSRV